MQTCKVAQTSEASVCKMDNCMARASVLSRILNSDKTESWSVKVMKRISFLLPDLSVLRKCNVGNSAANAKPFSSIPGPKGLPLLGSALEYTFIGRFTPKEYHKALMHRHRR